MNKKSLPYDLVPHEIVFLILAGVAIYACGFSTWPIPWPLVLVSAALVAAVPVLIWRCREEWKLLPNRWFFLSLAAAWVLLFSFWGNAKFGYLDQRALPAWMYYIYVSTQADEEHGLLIPFVVLVLYWWKRKELVAKPAGIWWPAAGLVAVALLLHLAGFKAQQQRLSVLAFLLGLYGLTGLAWGRHWLKASFFPFFLLLFCMPVGDYAMPLTLPLRLLVSRIVEIIAHLGLAPDLIRDGTQLFDAQRTFAYEVAAACSGIRSLVALLALAIIYGFINFKSPWKRLVMMAAALPLAVLGNVVRLCFTIMVAETLGQKAGKAVETDAGFLTFGVAILCVFWLSRWLEKFPDRPAAASAPAAIPAEPAAAAPLSRPAPAFLKPVLFAVVVAMVGLTASLLSQVTANQRLGLPGVQTRPLAGSQNLEVLLPETVPGFASKWESISDIVTNMLPQDTSFGQRLYTAPDGFMSRATVVLMGSSRSSIHDPQICLTAQGWNINHAASSVEMIHLDSPVPYDLPVMRMMVSREVQVGGGTVLQKGIYVFWFVDADRYTAVRSHWMMWMAQDMVFKNVLDRWAYISFFAVCSPGEETATFDRMKKLISASVPQFQLVSPAAK